MLEIRYWWLKMTTLYYSNIGPCKHGYQFFNWVVVDDTKTSVPVAEWDHCADERFHIGRYHLLEVAS